MNSNLLYHTLRIKKHNRLCKKYSRGYFFSPVVIRWQQTATQDNAIQATACADGVQNYTDTQYTIPLLT